MSNKNLVTCHEMIQSCINPVTSLERGVGEDHQKLYTVKLE